MQLKTTVIMLVTFILTSCLRSSEYDDYQEFRLNLINNGGDLVSEYKKLSLEKKISVYLGAHEMHPSDRRIAELAFQENAEFIYSLRLAVSYKDNYVATIDFVGGTLEMYRDGRISSDQLAKMRLKNLCRALSTQSSACLERIKDQQDEPKP